MIIIPIKWLFHWEYTLFSDKPLWVLGNFWYGYVQIVPSHPTFLGFLPNPKLALFPLQEFKEYVGEAPREPWGAESTIFECRFLDVAGEFALQTSGISGRWHEIDDQGYQQAELGSRCSGSCKRPEFKGQNGLGKWCSNRWDHFRFDQAGVYYGYPVVIKHGNVNSLQQEASMEQFSVNCDFSIAMFLLTRGYIRYIC